MPDEKRSLWILNRLPLVKRLRVTNQFRVNPRLSSVKADIASATSINWCQNYDIGGDHRQRNGLTGVKVHVDEWDSDWKLGRVTGWQYAQISCQPLEPHGRYCNWSSYRCSSRRADYIAYSSPNPSCRRWAVTSVPRERLPVPKKEYLIGLDNCHQRFLSICLLIFLNCCATR